MTKKGLTQVFLGSAALLIQISTAFADASQLSINKKSAEDKALLAPYEKLLKENPVEAERIKQLAIQQKAIRDMRTKNIEQFATQFYTPEMPQLALIEYYREEQRQKKQRPVKQKPRQIEDLEPEQQLALNWNVKINYDGRSWGTPITKSEFPNYYEFHRGRPDVALKEIEDSEWQVTNAVDQEFNDWHGGKNVLGEAQKRRMKASVSIPSGGATVSVDNGGRIFQSEEATRFYGDSARMSYLASLATPVNNPSFQEWKRLQMQPAVLSNDPKAFESIVKQYRTVLIDPRYYFRLRGFATAWEGHQASGCGWVKGDYAPFATPYCDVNGTKLPFPGKKYDRDNRPPAP